MHSDHDMQGNADNQSVGRQVAGGAGAHLAAGGDVDKSCLDPAGGQKSSCIKNIPERVFAAKTALWSALLTGNSLIAAGVIAWVYASNQIAVISLFVAAIASIVGILAPLLCLATVASAEARAAGLGGFGRIAWLFSMRGKSWEALEILSVLCLLGSFGHLVFRMGSGSTCFPFSGPG